ncbi:DUF6779 domain-containing protein [Gordonia sp. ABSL49_1]|uniref:DUF6779 domain-containing protein n=1 Tax=Gordonia sp. ABSL49_1 TaxID=2920941 RepID=UPI001F102A26|nr:DUF6779 domain-containing protein [Gordonia sp. ABSL49_1]MCH5643769.1 hypothetical protein [Gordonia sp. ABSL49_1]
MTTSNGRSTEPRRSGRSVGQWLLGLLIVLALAASILMVFTDQLSIPGSLAVIAALWAAVIGAILVTKFRRQAESAEAKSRDLRLVYELQLEREIAARRQYELDVETTIRREVSAEANEELSELKAQVLALRSSLEMLIGEPLPDQRTALPNEKMRELASGLGSGYGDSGFGDPGFRGSPFGAGAPDYGRSSGFADDDALAARDFAATAPAGDDGRHIDKVVDPNEMTEVIPVVIDDPLSGRIATEVPLEDVADDEVSVTEAVGEVSDAEVVEPPSEPVVEEPPQAAETPAQSMPFSGGFYVGSEPPVAPGTTPPAPFTDETPTDEWAREAVANAAKEAPADVAPDAAVGRHEGGPDATPAASFGRRRRRDVDDNESSHSAGLPVSELLGQLRAAESTGGRRRRAD